MIKRISIILLSLMFLFVFSGCALVDVPDVLSSKEPTELTIEGDKMCGIFVVFYDKNFNALTSEDLDSDNAVKYYLERKEYDGTDKFYIETQVGLEIWTDGHVSHNVSDNNSGISIELTINYTSELAGAVMILYGVYYSEEEHKCYAESGGTGHTLQDSITGGAGLTQTLSASRTNIDGTTEEISYECSVNITYKMIDNLTGVKILEYGSDNALIKSTDYIKGSGTFTTDADCDYVVVEKEYSVVYDYEFDTVKYNGMTYCEREIIERPLYTGNQKSVSLLYPQGNGFVDSEFLHIKFA